MSSLVEELFSLFFVLLNHDVTSCVLRHWFTFMPLLTFLFISSVTPITQNLYKPKVYINCSVYGIEHLTLEQLQQMFYLVYYCSNINQLKITVVFILLLIQGECNNGKGEFQLFYEKHTTTQRQLPKEYNFQIRKFHKKNKMEGVFLRQKFRI